MDKSNKMRKRKRPSYLDDFFASVTGEVPASKKFTALNGESEQDCELCSNIAESSATVWDVLGTTGVSKHTLSDVLNTLFTEEQLPQHLERTDFSEGHLCKICKNLVSDLDRLQHEVMELKKSIISVYKKAKHTEKKKKGHSTTSWDGNQKAKQGDNEKKNKSVQYIQLRFTGKRS